MHRPVALKSPRRRIVDTDSNSETQPRRVKRGRGKEQRAVDRVKAKRTLIQRVLYIIYNYIICIKKKFPIPHKYRPKIRIFPWRIIYPKKDVEKPTQ